MINFSSDLFYSDTCAVKLYLGLSELRKASATYFMAPSIAVLCTKKCGNTS